MWLSNSADRFREFVLAADAESRRQDFYFTYARRMGARKFFADGSATPDLRFKVWAPNAQRIEVIFGKVDNGYIADDGYGIDPGRPVISLSSGPGGIWTSEVIPDFSPGSFATLPRTALQ